MPTRKMFRENRERRANEAKERQAASDKLSPQERLDRLDSLFGKDVGAQKERARLLAKIEKNARKS